MRPVEGDPTTARRGDDDIPEAQARPPLTRQQAQALRVRRPTISPWRVVGVQVVVGVLLALLAGVVFGDRVHAWSALYGAAAVVLPGALMARGMTSRLGRVSPAVGAVSFMLWELVKIGVAVGMLMLAPRLVQPLSWPALLAGLVVCIKVYWFALLWRGR
ncbi:MAG: ATP synthase subunit I [Burkholderiales bacterium]|nr:ATP synthase subunit I [Burkholderiales bacterium]